MSHQIDFLRAQTTALRREGRPEQAIALLKSTLNNPPSFNIEAAALQLPLRAAEVFLQQGKLNSAQKIWSHALRRLTDPKSLPERIDRFKLLISLKKYREAIHEAERILDQDNHPRTINELKMPWSIVMFSRPDIRNSFKKDQDILQGMIRSRPSNPWAYFYLSQLNTMSDIRVKNPIDSIANFRAGRYGWMWFELGHSRLQRCDFKGAIKAFAAAAKSTQPPLWRAYAFAGEALLCLRRGKTAFDYFKKAQAAAPPEERADVLAWIGEMHLWLGDYRKAIACLEKAAEGGALYAYCWLGAAKLKSGNAHAALKDLDLGLKLLPRDREAYLWRGETKISLKDYAGALEDLGMEPFQGLWSSRWLWHRVNYGIAQGALKNYGEMREAFDSLPKGMIKHIKNKLAFPLEQAPNAARIIKILQTSLTLARGYRRPEHYGYALWMDLSGAQVRDIFNEKKK